MSRNARIGVNAFASAACFVAGLLVAAKMSGLLAIGTVLLGFVALAFFLNRAERARAEHS